MKKIFIAVIAGLVFSSCVKEEVSHPTFDVSVDKLTYQVGDTVTFNFAGNADYITLYSGEPGSEYIHRNRTKAIGRVSLELVTHLRNTLGVKTLNVFATTKLNPERDSVDVVNLDNWTDITSRFNLPTAVTSAPGVNAGNVDIADILTDGKPLYIGFRYTSKNNTRASDRWQITTAKINNTLGGDIAYPIATIANMDWKFLRVSNKTYGWVNTVTSTTSILEIATAPQPNTGDSDFWAVSGPLTYDDVLRDRPKTVKDILEVFPDNYKHAFKAKGTYKVNFIATNNLYGQTSEKVKEVEITIE